jgi:NADPH-dependent 2,4-dienoyl-CoA reductase/sulfur reductase-like enzyme
MTVESQRISPGNRGHKATRKTTTMMKLPILLSLLTSTKSFTSPSIQLLVRHESSSPATALQAKKYVVIGGGWGGWGAAKALCENDDVEVTLIDALPDPTGVSWI